MDPSPDPKKTQIEIWEAWFDQMADGGRTRRSLARLTRSVPFLWMALPLKRNPGDTSAPEMVFIPLQIMAKYLIVLAISRQTGRARIPNQDHTPWPRVRMR